MYTLLLHENHIFFRVNCGVSIYLDGEKGLGLAFNFYVSLDRNFIKCSNVLTYLFAIYLFIAFKVHKETTKPNREADAGDDAGGSFTK